MTNPQKSLCCSYDSHSHTRRRGKKRQNVLCKTPSLPSVTWVCFQPFTHRMVLNMHWGDWHIWLSLRPRHKTGIYCHGDGMPHRQNRSEWWERISIIPPASSTRFKAQTLPAHTSFKSPLAIKPWDLFIFVKLPLSFTRNWFLPSFVAAIGACVWKSDFCV